MRIEKSRRPIIFLDGECVMCDALGTFVLTRDSSQRLQLSTLQGATAAELLTPAERAGDYLAVRAATGRVRVASAAVVAVLWALPLRYRLVAAAIATVPPAVRDAAYRVVARRRYRWFGRKSSCSLPSGADHARILP